MKIEERKKDAAVLLRTNGKLDIDSHPELISLHDE